MKLSRNLEDLHKFYDKWIEEHNIDDAEIKRKTWWAMFYAWKEGREWKE